MNKYTIFRMPAEDDENYDQHELVGVEYGEDIYDVTDIHGDNFPRSERKVYRYQRPSR